MTEPCSRCRVTQSRRFAQSVRAGAAAVALLLAAFTTAESRGLSGQRVKQAVMRTSAKRVLNSKKRVVLKAAKTGAAQAALLVSPKPPVIVGLYHNAKGWLRGGDTVRVFLEGTANAQGAFSITGIAGQIPLLETTPGRYVGTWQVPATAAYAVSQTSLTATLTLKNLVSTPQAASSPLALDTLPPEISDLSPAPDSRTAAARLTISAHFADQGSGVDTNAVHVYLNGRNIVPETQITPDGFTFLPLQALPVGAQEIRVVVQDRAGNVREQVWQFTVTP